LFFADRYYGYDDALYTACRLLEILSKSGKPLSAQLADLPRRFSTPELRLACPDDQKFAVVAKTAALVAKDYSIVDIDGVRVPFEEGCWGLVRASNTQPVLVMRFEATSQALLTKYRAYLEGIVEKAMAPAASEPFTTGLFTTGPGPRK
jgi:phosphomannomutase/phosphoglucomutase